ncbi:intercompartmental signaling factor BofC (plasmid) [Bacillus sp. 31A1R]|uniref:Intercompartmental signaling factor BofC n=1 Tax=Robertmurraya mangrovi TaxID=3098077 RepID=A0ABU5IUL7_9BACI|nr:intercompartmental signaling factor BofC [Bacillus sp. 31A1R]MDZ5470839.1 intercompartmental signaling factor BofC [Bacillus sp. 31A1R]
MRTKWYSKPCMIVLLTVISFFLQNGLYAHQGKHVALANEIDNHNNFKPFKVKVTLERVYLDGEVSQEVIKETVWSMEEFWAKYENWVLIDMEDKKVYFRKPVDDISPLLKANGYFGITDDGTLTIFNGKPRRYNIIQSFFQIDMGRLESTKREQLLHGIPIKDKSHYVEVLETFKIYTVQEKQAN